MNNEYDTFEWDERKREANLLKHGVDFADASTAITAPHLVTLGRAGHEARWIALVKIGHRIVAVIYTLRNRSCRIISARVARRNERKTYDSHFGA